LFADGVARLSLRVPRGLIAGGAVVLAITMALLPRFARDPFEYNFKNLRSARSESNQGEGRWLSANQQVFARALTPIIILAQRAEQVPLARAALRAADSTASGAPMLDRVLSIEDLLPGSVSAQMHKIATMERIRGLMHDPSFKLLDDEERAKVQRYQPPEQIMPVADADLPPLVRLPFTERDGMVGRVLLAFPNDATYSPWDGRDMMRLAERVAEVKLPDGTVLRSAGTAVIFAGMIRAIVRDGPRATLASALGVMLLVLALARGLRGAALVLGTLLAGVVWMLGGAWLLTLRVNFLNFVALPVTLGIGVDYGINIYLRYRLEGPGRLYAAVRATGGAVALCSTTTIIGYGALLVADNRGLRSFGELAILGEIACLAAALVFMPAWLALRERRGGGIVRRLEAEARATPAMTPARGTVIEKVE
jgi:hypothetical protein